MTTSQPVDRLPAHQAIIATNSPAKIKAIIGDVLRNGITHEM